MERSIEQKEGECDPEVGEAHVADEHGQRALDEERFRRGELRHGPEDPGIRDLGILARHVRDDEVCHDEHEVLQPDREPVYSAIRDEVCDDTGEYTRKQDAQHQRGPDNCSGARLAVHRREVRGEWDEDLRDDTSESDEECDHLEGDERARDREPDGKGRGHKDEQENELPPLDHVAERRDEQQPTSIPCLRRVNRHAAS